MKFPHQLEERRLSRLGYKFVAGVDEAGRGALAGPIVAAAVILPLNHQIKGIRDSKKVSAKKRQELFQLIIRQAVAWSWHRISAREIDQQGIQTANHQVLKKAALKLKTRPFFLLIDAFKLDVKIPSKSIIKGDEKIVSIAAASIIAKVKRDKIMANYHRQYPQYLFHQHKGYGTKLHFERLKKYGPSAIHRQSFKLDA